VSGPRGRDRGCAETMITGCARVLTWRALGRKEEALEAFLPELKLGGEETPARGGKGRSSRHWINRCCQCGDDESGGEWKHMMVMRIPMSASAQGGGRYGGNRAATL